MTKLIVDVPAATAELDVVINGVVVTVFHLANGSVTLDASAEIVVTNAEFPVRLLQIKNWIGVIDSMIRPAYTPKVKYKVEHKKTNSGCEASYTLTTGANVVVTEAEYNHAAKVTTFAPRVGIVLAWSDFVRWVNFLTHIYDEISTW